jgi:hypothetical protein
LRNTDHRAGSVARLECDRGPAVDGLHLAEYGSLQRAWRVMSAVRCCFVLALCLRRGCGLGAVEPSADGAVYTSAAQSGAGLRPKHEPRGLRDCYFVSGMSQHTAAAAALRTAAATAHKRRCARGACAVGACGVGHRTRVQNKTRFSISRIELRYISISRITPVLPSATASRISADGMVMDIH